MSLTIWIVLSLLMLLQSGIRLGHRALAIVETAASGSNPEPGFL
jgi:hypothetical protein